jgi:hypothetical protein
MRTFRFLFVAAALACAHHLFAADGDAVRVRALLVLASKNAAESDARLAAYEPTLRRILRFESFRLAGEGSTELATPGKASVGLGRGHSLDLDAEKSDGRSVRLRVSWQGEGRSLMNTGLSLRGGVPAVLGGPAHGKDEVWAVILIAE